MCRRTRSRGRSTSRGRPCTCCYIAGSSAWSDSPARRVSTFPATAGARRSGQWTWMTRRNMETSDQVTHGLQRELEEIVEAAHRVSADVGAEVDDILRLGYEKPLGRDQAVALLQKVLTRLRSTAKRRGDNKALRSLAGDIEVLVERLVSGRQRKLFGGASAREMKKSVSLVARDGITPEAVRPTPFFHGHEVPMMVGFVKTSDIELWSKNDRLEIHLGQFQQKHGRRPHGQELLEIMLSKMELP